MMDLWPSLSARASLASHRLIGWIYWDPEAIKRYAELGVKDGVGYYIVSRGAPLGPAGHQVVASSFYSISPIFIEACLGMAEAMTSFDAVTDARNAAVGDGLRLYVPEICDELERMGPELWMAAESLPLSARPLFAAHLGWKRSPDPLVSAWLAVNCIREWRGDSHWTVLAAEALSGIEAGILHNAFLNYPEQWIPRSRGADDAGLAEAFTKLEARGYASKGKVNEAGLAFRQELENRTDKICEKAWRFLGEDFTVKFLNLIEPIGERLLNRINETAGPEWMPAARPRRDA